MPKELLIKGGHVVTVDPDLGDLPVGDGEHLAPRARRLPHPPAGSC